MVMQFNSGDLTKALDKLKEAVNADTTHLHEEEAALKANEAAEQKLKDDLKRIEAEIAQKLKEIEGLKQQVRTNATNVSANDREHGKLKVQIEALKRDQVQKQQELVRTTQEYTRSLQSSKVDVKDPTLGKNEFRKF